MLCLSTPHADCILPVRATEAPTSTLPQHAPRRMHLDVAPVSANASALPQHVLRGLHRNQLLLQLYNMGFASARPTRIASCDKVSLCIFSTLCLSTSYADCIRARHRCQSNEAALPQHVLRGLHPGFKFECKSSSRLCLSTSYADCIACTPYLTATSGTFASARPTRIASADRRGV